MAQAPRANELQEIAAVFNGERWRARDGGPFVVVQATIVDPGKPDEPATLVGEADRGELLTGVSYRFFGKWETGRHGKQFRFKNWVKGQPHNRHGLVKYLDKYCEGIGPAIAGRLFDALGSQAVAKLRNDPVGTVDAVNTLCRRQVLTVDVARSASESLRAVAKMEDTEIAMIELFSGRGFPAATMKQVIAKLGSMAPERIRRDPFVLLAMRFPGCGFLRVDKLYKDLGLPVTRIKRQLFALLHAMRSDGNGHTWFSGAELGVKLRQAIDGLTPRVERVVELGVRGGWLAVWREPDQVNPLTGDVVKRGAVWVAEKAKADAEAVIAGQVAEIQRWLVMVTRRDERTDRREEGSEHGGAGQMIDREDQGLTGRDPEDNVTAKIRRGRETGVCQFCGRELDNPISVEHGYGPTCAIRFGLPWGMPQSNEQDGVSLALHAEESELAEVGS